MGIVRDLGLHFIESRPRDSLTDYSTFSKWRVIPLSQGWVGFLSIENIIGLKTLIFHTERSKSMTVPEKCREMVTLYQKSEKADSFKSAFSL